MNISKLAFPVIFRQLRFFRDFFVPLRLSAPWSPRVGWTGPCVNAVAVSVILRKRIFCFRTGTTWREGLYYKFMWIFLITIKTARSRILPVLFYVLLLCCYESIDFTSWPGKLDKVSSANVHILSKAPSITEWNDWHGLKTITIVIAF